MQIELYHKLNDQIAAIERTGDLFATSGLFGVSRREQGFVLALECYTRGKTPSEILQTYDIVEGRLRKKALAALAEFRSKGGKHRWNKSGDEPATKPEDRYAELWLKSADGEEITYRYSMADAAAEGLIRDKSRWVKRPGNMLRARCISNGLGMLDPGIYAGGDEDSDEPTGGEQSLNLGKPAEAKTEPKSEPKPETRQAKVIDVQTTVETSAPPVESRTAPKADEPELAKMGLAPQAAPASATPAPAVLETQPAKSEPAPSQAIVTPGKVDKKYADAETIDKVEKAIGDIAPKAVSWMFKQGWLKPGEDFSKLEDVKARRILNNIESFRNAVLQ